MRPYARFYWKKSSIRTVRDSVNSSWAVISRLARRDASWTKEGWKRKNDDQMIKSFLIELGQARSWRVNHATLSPVLQPSKWFPSAHAPPPPPSFKLLQEPITWVGPSRANKIHEKNYSVLIGSDKCSFQVIQCRRGLIQCKEVTNQTEKFLELFSRTLNVFAFLRCENIIVYYFFDRLFWPNAWFE